MPRYGLIGGTGINLLEYMANARHETVDTRRGPARLVHGELDRVPVVYLPRHGLDHSAAPHEINYAANLLALQKVGVDAILSTAACGSLNNGYLPGDIVLLSDVIDLTRQRSLTIREPGAPPSHTDMSLVFSPRMRAAFMEASDTVGTRVHDIGVYICVDGPRYETPAEIRMMRQMGADLVGMTLVPEVFFAAELQIPYASVAVVTNLAAGMSPAPIRDTEIHDIMRIRQKQLVELISITLQLAMRDLNADD